MVSFGCMRVSQFTAPLEAARADDSDAIAQLWTPSGFFMENTWFGKENHDGFNTKK